MMRCDCTKFEERPFIPIAALKKTGSLMTLRTKTAFDSLNVRFWKVEARFVHARQREPTSLRIRSLSSWACSQRCMFRSFFQIFLQANCEI